MGWNGSGTFNRSDGTRSGTQVWQDAKTAGVKIRADDHDVHDQDIADGLENTVALDGQTTTTTDNAILRYDSGNTQFEGVTISASQIVGRSAAGDTRGMSAATARQTIGVGSAAPTNNQFLYWASASSQYVQATAATARSLIGLGTAAPTNDKLLAFSSSSNQYVETSYTSTDVSNVTGVITTEDDLMVGDSSGNESRLAKGSNNTVLRVAGNGSVSWGTIQSGDFTAGAVDQAAVGASAIGQGETKTTTTTESTSTAGRHIRSTAAGSYGIGFRSRANNDDISSRFMGAVIGRAEVTSNSWGPVDEAATSDTGTVSFITLYTEDADAFTHMEVRYFQASPPYDMGDGECGLFVSLDVDGAGGILGASIAPDPMWANNGPTDIRPDWTDPKTGKKYKRVRRPAVTRADVDAGRADMADYAAAMREAKVEDVEIDFAFKNADMDLFPHSWVSPPQGTIVLLDPVNTHDLLMLHEAGEDVADLIHKGYVRVGDEVKRKGPPGVVPVTWKWKNSR